MAFGVCVPYRRERARVNRERVAAVEKPIKRAVAAIENMDVMFTSAYEELRPQTWLEKQFDDPGDSDDPVGVVHVEVALIGFEGGVDETFFEHQITAVEQLAKLTDLQWSLLTVGFTDVGLKRLKGLSNLRNLSLSNENVTDAGLKHLTGLKSLQNLYLRGTNVTDAGVKKLQQALPNCKIHL